MYFTKKVRIESNTKIRFYSDPSVTNVQFLPMNLLLFVK